MKKWMALLTALCVMLAFAAAPAESAGSESSASLSLGDLLNLFENGGDNQGGENGGGLDGLLGGLLDGENGESLDGLLGGLLGGENGESLDGLLGGLLEGENGEGLEGLLGGLLDGENGEGLEGLLGGLLGGENGEGLDGLLGGLLEGENGEGLEGLLGGLRSAGGEKADEVLGLIGALFSGERAAAPENRVSAAGMEAFYGVWELSRVMVGEYALSADSLDRSAGIREGRLVISETGIGLRLDGEDLQTQGIELTDGALKVTAGGTDMMLYLTDAGELCGCWSVLQMYFTKAE